MKLENAAFKNEAELNAKSLEEGAKRWKEEVEKEGAKREEMENKLRWSDERVDRLEAEGERLRGEIRFVLSCLWGGGIDSVSLY